MESDLLAEFNSNLEKIKEGFIRIMKTLPTGRAHPSILDGVVVEVYETKQPLKQLATILTTEAKTLKVTPFDSQNINLIVEALKNHEGADFNPTDDGRVIYVPISPLTTDRRHQIVKQLHTQKETCLIQVRQQRHALLKTLKNEIDAEDELKSEHKNIENLVANFKTDIDQLVDSKTKEILEV